MGIAVLAEADAGRDRDIGLGQQQLGEGERAQFGELLGDWRPGEHGSFHSGRVGREVPTRDNYKTTLWLTMPNR